MKSLGIFLFAITLMAFAGSTAQALPLEHYTPPSDFGADDGTELFVNEDWVASLEMRDIPAQLGQASSFGFYFESDPSEIITIFEPGDDVTIGMTSQIAVIDFNNGRIYDWDDFTIQSTFTPGTGPIAFVASFEEAGSDVIYSTDASANPDGEDMAATYPWIGEEDKYLIGFEVEGMPVMVDLVAGVVPYVAPTPAMPEPGGFLLFAGGFTTIVLATRRRR
ncbi:MAG: hypothetical protein QNK03_01680 [Myxococcota bacterium]|nr:hypothetical protein [Myxococcota bacterium]